LSPLLFNVALENVISKVQENQLGLKFSGTHQLLVSAYDIKLLRGNINTKTHTHTEAPLDASKEMRIERDIDKTKCALMSRHQSEGQRHYINICNRSFENVAKFKYMGKIAINENLIHEETKFG
jgi:hypothetical protein